MSACPQPPATNTRAATDRDHHACDRHAAFAIAARAAQLPNRRPQPPSPYFARTYFLARVSPTPKSSPALTMSETCLRAVRSVTLAILATAATVT